MAEPGHWEGDFWVEASGYKVHRRFVEKYPGLYGPNKQDPDQGQGDTECDDLLSKLSAKFTGAGGTLSTWMERHCFFTAGPIGYFDVRSSTDVPPCPDFWLKEQQYWIDGIIIGRGAAKVEEAAPSIKTYAAIFLAGNVTGGSILKTLGL